MSWTVPSSTPYSIKRRERGIKVWAIQRALNRLGWKVAEDGSFGAKTENAVKALQIAAGLTPDGVFGPQTSRAVAERLSRGVEDGKVPAGVIRGVIEGESGGLIAAVNHSVPGGVDVGYLQRRVYAADYANDAVIQRAFDGRYQMGLLATSLKGRHDAFFGMTGAKTHEQAWRLAVLNHNWPAGAAKIADVGIGGLSSYYTTPQPWVGAIGAKFPDGTPIRTPLEWAQHYSLGNSAHDEPGVMVKYVTNWTP